MSYGNAGYASLSLLATKCWVHAKFATGGLVSTATELVKNVLGLFAWIISKLGKSGNKGARRDSNCVIFAGVQYDGLLVLRHVWSPDAGYHWFLFLLQFSSS